MADKQLAGSTSKCPFYHFQKHVEESNDRTNQNMDQDEFVIFAELKRDHFDEILHSVTGQFKNIQSGRQGDDWIWIHLGDDKIEIDSFYSMELEVKGKRKHYATARQVVQKMEKSWIIQIFDPPKVDQTR